MSSQLDVFACAAMQSLLATNSLLPPKDLAKRAYVIAGEMVAASEINAMAQRQRPRVVGDERA
jgi:4'-phosphopantetheinyl transferase EntD